jgi:hypothetical protein
MTSESNPASTTSNDGSGQPGLPKLIRVNPVTEMTQDARFAIAMSGGVSLAVWMGGVSREVNLLQLASDARRSAAGMATPWAGPDPTESAWDAAARTLYRNLLELLDVTVTVDVLSGTSAGGVNAALLGMSSAVNDWASEPGAACGASACSSKVNRPWWSTSGTKVP